MRVLLLLSLCLISVPAFSDSLGSQSSTVFFKSVSLRVCGSRYVKLNTNYGSQWLPRETCEDVVVPSNGQCLPSGQHLKVALDQLSRYMKKYPPDNTIVDLDTRVDQYYSQLFTFKSVETFHIADYCQNQSHAGYFGPGK